MSDPALPSAKSRAAKGNANKPSNANAPGPKTFFKNLAP